MRNPRALLAAGVLVVAAAIGVLLVVLLPGGGEPGSDVPEKPLRVTRATLTLEQAQRPDTGGRELLVSLPAEQLNSREITGGARVVWLRCLDDAGAVVVRQPFDWPLVEEEGFMPHIHHPLATPELKRVRRCRLTAPGMDFAASVKGSLPTAALSAAG